TPRSYLLRYLNLATDRAAALVLAPSALATVRAAGTAAIAGVALAVLDLRLRVPQAAPGVLGERELLQALAQQHVVPVLSVEGAAVEEPLVHRRWKAVLDPSLRDAELRVYEALERLTQEPFPLPVSELQAVRELHRELDDPVVQEGIPHLDGIAHAQAVGHDEERLQENRRLQKAQVLGKRPVVAPHRSEEL